MEPIETVLGSVLPDGSYAYSRPPDSELARRLEPEKPPPTSRLRAPKPGVDATDLSSTGWGVIYPYGRRPHYEPLLRDLLELRREQAGDLYMGGDELLVEPNERCSFFLERRRANTGQADPERLPYYLLLVGSPEEISFEFQGELDQVYAVGRLYFEEDEQYRAYAAGVKRAEEGLARAKRRTATLWGARNENDLPTERTTERLMVPLAGALEARTRGNLDWRIERILGDAATRDRLRERLSGTQAPDVLVTASHGMAFRLGDPRQRALQGALLASDWAGPGHPAERHHYLAAEDLAVEGRPLEGSVTFHVACHSGGTPEWDSFAETMGSARRIAERPFVAALPQRLLGEAGALATIAHVDRAWTTSFEWGPPVGKPDPKAFVDTVAALLDRQRVGFATENLGAYYSLVSSQVYEEQNPSRNRRGPQLLEHTARLWRTSRDIRSFVLFGDPAVRVGGAQP